MIKICDWILEEKSYSMYIEMDKKLNAYSKKELIEMVLFYKKKCEGAIDTKKKYNKMYSQTDSGKEAMKRAGKKYYEKNKATIRARQKEYRERIKKEKEEIKNTVKKVIDEINN